MTTGGLDRYWCQKVRSRERPICFCVKVSITATRTTMKTRRLFLREMTGEYLEAQTTICPNMSKLTFFVSLCACSLSAHRRARSLPVTCLIVWHLARIEQSLARRRREWAHAWWLGAWIRWKNVRVCLSRTGWQQEIIEDQDSMLVCVAHKPKSAHWFYRGMFIGLVRFS